MSDLDRSVIYTYTIQTNLSEIKREADTTLPDTDQQVVTLEQDMESLQQTTEQSQANLVGMQNEIKGTILTLTAMASAVNGVTNGLITLGIVSDEDAEKVRMVNAGFQVLIGMATGLKALALVQEMLNLQALKGAIINTYNSVLESPWKLALASAGMGAAAGVAAAYGTQGGSSSSQTTNIINIRDISGGQASAANSISTIYGDKVLWR